MIFVYTSADVLSRFGQTQKKPTNYHSPGTRIYTYPVHTCLEAGIVLAHSAIKRRAIAGRV